MVLADAKIYNDGVVISREVALNQSKKRSSWTCLESDFTSVALSGIVVPRKNEPGTIRNFDYNLVSASGLEYFLVANREWRNVLSAYSWEEVKIVGLLNTANRTLIPQKVFPKGPKGERENVIDLALWKSREAMKKIAINVNDLVLVPAAVLAVAGFEVIY